MTLQLKTTHSKDGTKIAYYQIGSGPGLIILHGAMQAGLSHSELATHLSQSFTCYLPDRRGRNKSGPTGEDYSTRKEVQDVESIHVSTGAKYIFGVSSGAFITLKAALAAPSSHIERIAVFEPPWLPESEREATMDWVRRYEEEIGRGEVAEALTTAMLGTQMGPPLFHSKYFPRVLLVWLSKMMLGGEQSANRKSKKGNPPREDSMTPPSFQELASTLQNDFKVGAEMFGEQNLETLAAVKTETLVLGGSRSPAYLRRAVRELEKVIPHARRVELEGVSHVVTCNKAQGGKPEIIARELQHFFLLGNHAKAPKSN
ncbi:uncharacterized protein Z518_06791 [Rhinocladiella mackenziei CBS 650.93]|uniref:AB hydrolase-1 domain-containing protein n=1 Tax=Rhinocladiella mackenziei CBS 650.93 TaxID=1442369 RepID=A0A0D2IBP5_9EURO|nr:uncharacterized protein Z518_06791 [Rhinocladiella mackenziei CBS 650.93]KIX03239.1 hypothetical protein Z518_06791 [Rhinocladiella mackenziei CBS 650.93]